MSIYILLRSRSMLTFASQRYSLMLRSNYSSRRTTISCWWCSLRQFSSVLLLGGSLTQQGCEPVVPVKYLETFDAPFPVSFLPLRLLIFRHAFISLSSRRYLLFFQLFGVLSVREKSPVLGWRVPLLLCDFRAISLQTFAPLVRKFHFLPIE